MEKQIQNCALRAVSEDVVTRGRAPVNFRKGVSRVDRQVNLEAFGFSEPWADANTVFYTESLILAQNERWRRG